MIPNSKGLKKYPTLVAKYVTLPAILSNYGYSIIEYNGHITAGYNDN